MENESPAFRGIFPILATCFDLEGSIDYESQERLIEFCIERGVHGLVTLANASEGHLLSDAEKQELLSFILKQIDGRIPVIATINHPSSIVAAQARAMSSKWSTSRAFFGGKGTRFTFASVTPHNVPADPTTIRAMLRPPFSPDEEGTKSSRL